MSMQNRKPYCPILNIVILLIVWLLPHSVNAQEQIDTLAFLSQHHYGFGYNFIVKSDSLLLISQQPEEMLSDLPIDSFFVKKHTQLVIADIRMMPSDPIDSVWLKVGTGEMDFGWFRECDLLNQTVPDDPISQCISFFSDIHVLVSVILVCLLLTLLLIFYLRRQNAYVVHFNDIRSFYPTLLCIIVAVGATLYASIQHFATDEWINFYFNPTLNPLGVSPLIALFLINFWLIILLSLAVIDDVRHQLDFGDAILYLVSLGAVCAVDYILFSLTTLYFIGYPLLVVYILFAIWIYLRKGKATYICGNCGAKLAKKGKCPRCGALNS